MTTAASKITRFGIWHICTRPLRNFEGRWVSFAIPRPFSDSELDGSMLDIPGRMQFEFGATAEVSLLKLHNDLSKIGRAERFWLWLTKGRWPR